FGIAKTTAASLPPVTATGQIAGTPGYMPPEQLAGSECTAQTDICSSAMVIFETFTGRAWGFESHTDTASWKGVPARAIAPLRRGLAWSPRDRWPDAEAFRGALRGRAPSYRWRWLAAAAAVALFATGMWFTDPPPSASATGMLRVHLDPFTASDAAAAPLTDSLRSEVLRALQGAADILVDTAGAAR